MNNHTDVTLSCPVCKRAALVCLNDPKSIEGVAKDIARLLSKGYKFETMGRKEVHRRGIGCNCPKLTQDTFSFSVQSDDGTKDDSGYPMGEKI